MLDSVRKAKPLDYHMFSAEAEVLLVADRAIALPPLVL